MKEVKINMGCGWRNFGPGWTHIDLGDYDHLDYKCDVSNDLPLDDNSVDLIYSSHVIAYFNKDEIVDVLTEWKRILKPGGTLRLATPDFEAISKLYQIGECNLHDFLGPLYGRMDMGDVKIYHKRTYDFFILFNLLESLGFSDIKRYDWRDTCHSEFDDHSQAHLPHMNKENGTLISLNIECKK